ncbi:MAG: PIG-L deacetylase family protein [Bryobacteraceae bacterium]
MDITPAAGNSVRSATSFAVHRQLAKVVSVELDKTFYTAGDPVNPRIVVRNFSNRQLDHLQVEFEAYTFPWIDPPPDAPPAWKTIVAGSLSLPPGVQREFRTEKAAVVQTGKEPVDIYFSVVIRDNRKPDEIYDLASAPPAFTVPPNIEFPKNYPRLYLYQRLHDVPKSEAYRQFYPREFVSDEISFDTSHTMFPTGIAPALSYDVKLPRGADFNAHLSGASIQTRVLDAAGRAFESDTARGTIPGNHALTLKPMNPGRYTLEVSLQLPGEITVAHNRLEFTVNPLPKSILVFCAHQDDDTAHPSIIRAAVENNIPIHVVYFTSGGGNGCDRYYMHACDPARAMDFGEVRMDEARASLAHLGVQAENIFFLGLPDGGLGQIWSRHVKADDPYLSELLSTDHAPFRDAAIPNLPYARDAVVAAAKEYIVQYKPDLIITGHPDERHVDHRTNNWIVVKAMQELLRDGKLSRDTQLVVDVAYGASRRKHAPYNYENYTLYVSGEVARIGQEALWYYQSQDGNHQQANIIEYNKLPRDEPYPHARIVDWQQHEGWNEQE